MLGLRYELGSRKISKYSLYIIYTTDESWFL